MMPVLRCLIPAAALIALCACDNQERTAAKASADGEILEGTASDAMLPLDTVRSQSPLAPRSEAASSVSGESKPRSRTRSSDDGDAPALPDPAIADPEPAAAADPVTPAEE